jgi:hypothetical protein
MLSDFPVTGSKYLEYISKIINTAMTIIGSIINETEYSINEQTEK